MLYVGVCGVQAVWHMCVVCVACVQVVQEKEGYTSSKTLISDQRLKQSMCRKNVSTYTMSSIPVFHVLHPNSRLFRIYASCRSAPAVDTCLVAQKNTVHQHLCTGVCSLFALVSITTPRPSWNQSFFGRTCGRGPHPQCLP